MADARSTAGLDRLREMAAVGEQLRQVGGGGGNRTRVRKCFHERIYVRSLSFKSSPLTRASGPLTSAARRLSFLPGQPPASRVGARCRRPLPLAGGHGGDGRPLLGRQRQVVVGSYWVFPLFTRPAGPRHATLASSTPVETGTPPRAPANVALNDRSLHIVPCFEQT